MKQISLFLLVLLILTSCSEGFYQDDNDTWHWKYYHGGDMEYRYIELDSIDHSQFKKLSQNFGTDGQHVLFRFSIIPDADARTFKELGNGYSRDNKSVYYETQKIIFAKPNSFKILGWPYSKDNQHVYCGTLPLDIPTDEVNSFVVNQTSAMVNASSYDFFLRSNPEYEYLDSNYRIVYGGGKGESKNFKFRGYKKVK